MVPHPPAPSPHPPALQSIKPVAFTYVNIFQTHNFLRNILLLIRFSDRFIATPKFQIFSMKPNIIKLSGICVNLMVMAKAYKYSIKSEAADSRVYCKKAVLKKFKTFAEKSLCMSLFLKEVAGLHH